MGNFRELGLVVAVSGFRFPQQGSKRSDIVSRAKEYPHITNLQCTERILVIISFSP